ncbi:MAG TPA: hypothetical protein VEZ47_12505 [Gemmatirosa sp.]|nr:hypothetical protein [Gemmatirosa sp.]
MHSSVLSRVSGLLLVLGGALGVAVPALHPNHGPAYYTDHRTAPVHLLLLGAVLLVSLGIPGLVAAQGPRWRPWAALSASLVFVGEWLLDGTHGIVDGAVVPALVQHGAVGAVHGATRGAGLADVLAAGPLGTLVDVGVPVMIVGCIALGVVLARGGVVPRWVAVLLACCWVLVPVSFVAPAVRGFDVALPYVAFLALGGALLRPSRVGAADAHGARSVGALARLATSE